MKKIIWILTTLVFFISLISILIYTLSPKEKLKITTAKKAYNCVSTYNEAEYFNIAIYANKREKYLFSAKNITSSHVSDWMEDNLIKIEITAIKEEGKLKIYSDEYYLYHLNCKIEFITEQDFEIEIEDAYLSVTYSDSKRIILPIGSFSFYKTPFIGDSEMNMSISNLRGIINESNGIKTLFALNAVFKNNTNELIEITKVKLFDTNIIASCDEIISVEENYHFSESIDRILGYAYEYHYSRNTADDMSYIIPPNGSLNYIIPIKYINEIQINRVGFMVEYKYNNKEYVMYFDEFTYFISNMTAKEIDKLEYFTYEDY